jgi:hypothetical protein
MEARDGSNRSLSASHIWTARVQGLKCGGCNAEASRRYLLESRALDPERQRLLLILPSLELRGPRRAVAAIETCCVVSDVPAYDGGWTAMQKQRFI